MAFMGLRKKVENGDWPEAQAGEAPAGAPTEAPDEADEAREDEEMTDLLDFLGGSGAA